MDLNSITGKNIGNYKIFQLMGEGGQSVVYKAFDEVLKRYVVIKFFLGAEDRSQADKEDERSFLLEARTLSQLSHPNIATIFTGGYFEDVPYIVIEWVDGKSLKEIIREKKKLNVNDAKKIVYHVARALSYAHKKGIVHRDIKPSNIMISKDNVVKLLDFGLVKILNDTIRKGMEFTLDDLSSSDVAGTPAYMSPEMIEGEGVDERSDLFSLGIVFYEMITGEKPFRRENYISTMLAIVNDPPANYLEEETCPDNIKKIIYRLLEKNPNKRFSSANELLSYLDVRENSVSIEESFSFKKKKKRGFLFLILFIFILFIYFLFLKKFIFFINPAKINKNGKVNILVIPFLGGPDKKDKYLADLITSKIIDALSDSADITVISSPINEKLTKNYLLNKILKNKNITYIIDGNLVMVDDDIRVTAKIVDNRNSTIVWSDTIEEKKDNLFRIPAIVASQVSRIANVYVSVEKLKFKFPNKVLFDHFTNGLLFSRQGKFNDAILEYKECLKIYPKFVPAYYGLAGEYLRKSDLGIGYSIKSLKLCKYYIDKGLSIDRKNLKLLNILGWYYYFTYNIKKSNEICKKIESIKPHFPFVHTIHAWVYLCIGDVEGFFTELGKYEHLRPTDWVPFLNEVVVGAMAGREDKVKKGINKIKEVYAQPFIIKIAEGWREMYRGNFKKAEKIFKYGYEYNGDPLSRLAIAESQFAVGDYKGASKNLEWWLDKNPYSLKGYWLLCLSYELNGEIKKEIESAKKGFLRASEMYDKFKNPTLFIYKKYFEVIFNRENVKPGVIKKVNLDGYGAFEKFLKIMILKRLGGRVELNFIPYDPKYWVSKFYKTELKMVEKKLKKGVKYNVKERKSF